MTALAYIAITLGTFVAMEAVTWFTHKYIMHGFMWYFHDDHHNPQHTVFEKNDAFFLIFATPSFLLMLFGSYAGFDWKFFLGFGIMLYGICYFLVHDVLIHQRFPWFKRTDNVYFRALRKAHKIHHKHRGPKMANALVCCSYPLNTLGKPRLINAKLRALHEYTRVLHTGKPGVFYSAVYLQFSP